MLVAVAQVKGLLEVLSHWADVAGFLVGFVRPFRNRHLLQLGQYQIAVQFCDVLFGVLVGGNSEGAGDANVTIGFDNELVAVFATTFDMVKRKERSILLRSQHRNQLLLL